MSDSPKTPPPAKGRGKLPLIGGAVALVAVTGGAGYWFMQKPAAAEGAEHAAPEPAAKRGLVSFDPFVVNLADPGVSRFLRVSMQLVLKSAEQAVEMEESKVAMMQARSAMLEVLTTQTSDVLVTPEGKAGLKSALIDKLHHVAEEFEVVDVLFSDFVVQF